MPDVLSKEFEYYVENNERFIKDYRGKVIALKDCKVIGVFESEIEAVDKLHDQGFEVGTFLVQRCLPNAHILHFHSRVYV